MQANRSDADRRARQSVRLALVLRLLQLIQGRGWWSARMIAWELECSAGAGYRDLQVPYAVALPQRFLGSG